MAKTPKRHPTAKSIARTTRSCGAWLNSPTTATTWPSRCKRGRGDYYLYSESGTNNLELAAKKSTTWNVSTGDDGTFVFNNAGDADYFLGIYTVNYVVFGNYKSNGNAGADNVNLKLYKLKNFAATTGSNAMPAEGDRVAFATAAKVSTSAFEGTEPEPYLLSDGTLAPADGLGSWTCHVSGSQFTLQAADGTYLGHDLSASATAAAWQILNGHIATAESTPRYLVYRSDANTFLAATADDINEAGGVSAILRSVGDDPTEELDSEGLKTLRGAWTADALAALSLDDVLALDLGEIILPAAPLAFANTPATPNMPVYVAESQQAYVPSAWGFVVLKGESANKLLTQVTLEDKAALYLPESFTAKAGQIAYERDAYADGGWETLCLPFACSKPSGFTVAQLQSVKDDEIIFEEVSSIAANTPLIILNESESGGTSTLTLSCQSGTVSTATPPTSGDLRGTYQPITISTESGIYFLDEDGQTFVLTAAGSHLAPFRAYLQLSSTTKTLRLRCGTTGIHSIAGGADAAADASCFSLDGRRAAKPADKGVYIVGSKKYIKF